jgi:ATP adenylyltransferase
MKNRAFKGECPFCEFIRTQEALAEKGAFVARFDSYPVSPGHTLLMPRRHIATAFELNENERRDFFGLLLQVRELLEEQYHPDGYNIGVNNGLAAGQTVMHLHIHVIPRYFGDVDNPRGGVRGVIPELTDYPTDTEEMANSSRWPIEVPPDEGSRPVNGGKQ